MTHLWIDASAGIAGDMLLGALIDAGADIGRVQAAIDAVLPGSVRITATEVRRAGLRARKVEVTPAAADQPHRTWRDIRDLLTKSPRAATLSARDTSLAPQDTTAFPQNATASPQDAAALPQDATLPQDVAVLARAAAVFARLAEAEAAVHGVTPDEVHFHEVGAVDAIADVVGVCAALDDLGVTSVSASEVAVGSGTVRAAHGVLPVPAPAVAELSRGWRIRSGGPGELATPTGMALLRALATTCEDLPSLTLTTVGVGAGARDTPNRPNVVRALIGTVTTASTGGTPTAGGDETPGGGDFDEAVVLEANVDDLDPRLWPGVITALLEAGADDAWLAPILMKKGRPAHTLSVLCAPAATAAVRERIFRETSTLGVRMSHRGKTALARTFVRIEVDGHPVAIKIGHFGGVIVQAMPEFEDVAALARALAITQRDALARAVRAAADAHLIIGTAVAPQRQTTGGSGETSAAG